MKLCILIESLLVKDEDKIILYRRGVLEDVTPFTGGKWYQDNILDHMQDDIINMEWNSSDRTWKVLIEEGSYAN